MKILIFCFGQIFGDRRWIDVQDPNLLNYENTQLLLIGARKKDVEEELGIDIDEEKESQGTLTNIGIPLVSSISAGFVVGNIAFTVRFGGGNAKGY